MSISNFSSGASRSVRHTVQQRGRVDLVGQLVRERRRTRRTLPWQLRVDLLGESFDTLAHLNSLLRAYRAIVLVRAIFFCSWMMPYTSASAVGGQPGT